MTRNDAVAHWRDGALHSWRAAQLLFQGGEYALCLFHCHLALEKALKAAIVEKVDAEPPKTHNLPALAVQSGLEFGAEELECFAIVNPFSLEARYGDMGWAESEATTEKTRTIMRTVEPLLGKLSIFLV